MLKKSITTATEPFKKTTLFKSLTVSALFLTLPYTVAAEDVELETLGQRLSYMIGNNIARQFERDEIDLDTRALAQGITDIMEGNEPQMTQEEIQAAVAEIQAKMQAKQEAARAEQEKEQAKVADANKAEGEAYLAENMKKSGVKVTESGLQYREITSGDGASPTAEDTVSVHYKGTLIDGTEFDSSYSRGEPATFPVTGVIPGWIEALQLMSVGDKWELTIPSDLAYGAGGTGGEIGPNATLIFEVELLDIVENDS